MSVERIFIVGGTGNTGKVVVDELIAKNAKVTLYARSPAKVASMFPTGDISVVEGDLQNLDPLKDAVKGHTRLFFLVADFALSMVDIKRTIATYAYEAGVKQIVDLSSLSAGFAARTNSIGEKHLDAERAVASIPNRGAYVTLRPGRFMSNMTTFDRILPNNTIVGTEHPDEPLVWISPNDIGAVAAAVLTDDIAKHGDAVYELLGARSTPSERVQALSRVLGKEVKYQQVTATEKYNQLIKSHLPHLLAYDLSVVPVLKVPEGNLTTNFPILIGREAETLEEYIVKAKDLF